MSRFRPMSEILAKSVTACNQNVTSQVIDKQGCNRVTTVTTFFKEPASVDGGGVAVATRDCFRAAEYTDITHEEAGMVQCRGCGHSQRVSQTAGRCRNPDLHGGRWCVLGSDMWRRCVGYQAKQKQDTTCSGSVGDVSPDGEVEELGNGWQRYG